LPDQTNVFATPDSSQPAQQQSTPISPFADQLAGIKKEDGTQKYDSVEKALEGAAHAQDYIPQLQSTLATKDAELVQLRAELDKRQSVEEVVSRITQPQEAPVTEPTAQVPQGLSTEDVAKLVQQELVKSQQQSTAQANVQKVANGIQEKFGANANDVVANKARELNTTTAALEQLASQSPEMVMALFNTAPQGTVSPTAGSHTIPQQPAGHEPLAPPESSLLSGSTSAKQVEFYKKVEADVHRKFGVTI